MNNGRVMAVSDESRPSPAASQIDLRWGWCSQYTIAARVRITQRVVRVSLSSVASKNNCPRLRVFARAITPPNQARRLSCHPI